MLKKRSLLVLDAFRCHRMQLVKTQLVANNTDLAIIACGMTKMLQAGEGRAALLVEQVAS